MMSYQGMARPKPAQADDPLFPTASPPRKRGGRRPGRVAAMAAWPGFGFGARIVALVLLLAAPAYSAAGWDEALQLARDAVISIQVDAPVAFDTSTAGSANATGFVVDAELGIVLTNRHVVRTGPVVATGTFRNQEQVDLIPLYRDPEHDFGFFRYDPAQLRYMKPRELKLAPELAKVGLEVRLVGNDAGEQLSIHAGTLARLDRNAPRYGAYTYNDFNTFYFQAATGTRSGSSGSPVLEIGGRVVALNAGGNNRSAASFYLPLERVVRALELLRLGEPVTRGTLQTVFTHQPFARLRELGLQAETEQALRDRWPELSGLLVVSQVVAGGPAAGHLVEGDILISVDDRPIINFVTLADQLDNRVGSEVDIEVERTGRRLRLRLPVADMHALEPARFLELGGAVLHELSYQQTRNFDFPRDGLYLADAGYLFGRADIAAPAVITHVNGRPVATLEDFLQAAAGSELLEVRYFRPGQRHAPIQRVARLEQRWHGDRICERRDAASHWACEPVSLPAPAVTLVPAPVLPAAAAKPATLVWVEFDLPYGIEGMDSGRRCGVGLIVDASQGLVVTDRYTVPVAMGDARITVGGRVDVPAQVVFLHPLHNLALLAFDPAALAGTPIAAAPLASEPVREGERLELRALNADQRLVRHQTTVTAVRPLRLERPRSARFQESNLDAVEIANPPGSVTGALFDEHGAVRALWANFERSSANDNMMVVGQLQAGIPAAVVERMLTAYRERQPIRSLEARLGYRSLAQARQLGLPAEWLALLADSPRVLVVEGTVDGTPAARQLQAGDLLLAVNGQPVHDLDEVERLIQMPEVVLDLLRDRQVQQVRVATEALTGLQPPELLLWAGAALHRPYRVATELLGLPRQGVYVASRSPGSPAQRYGLQPDSVIVAVNGVPVTDIETFLAGVAAFPERRAVLLHVISPTGIRQAITLRPEPHYWPVQLIRQEQGEWRRTQYDSEAAALSGLKTATP